jgi:hydrogenase expression/formation protein HypE
MDDRLPELGKIHPGFFDRVIYPRLGAPDPNILIGPRHGVDYGVIRLGDQVLALSTDPFFIVPAYGWRRAAWFAFHIIVSDVAVSGLRPRYLTVDLNLPPELDEAGLTEIWDSVHQEAAKYGISIVTGHTARYAGCNFPMVGGATIIGVGTEEELRGPHRVRPGDRVIITKGAAIEATGLLTATFPEYFRSRGGAEYQRRAENLFYEMSVVDDAAIARAVPGVHVMHDATECGVWGGLVEMAQAGRYGLRIEEAKIPVRDDVRTTCRLAGIDPFAAISEGTLLAVVAPEDAANLLAALNAKGILGAEIGDVTPAAEGLKRILPGGEARELVHPKVDPFWGKFEELRQAGAS